MVKIQLETGYLEVKDGTAFPLNFGVAEIRDVSSRSGAFSKSIKLVGSANNNKLLNHYYDVNIQEGTFDINALTRCSVLQNDIPILEDAYLQLISVEKVQNADGHDEGVEYTVVVKDAQADFFTKIDNAELTDLDFTDLNHTYNSTNVISSFSHTVTDGYVYPLTWSPDNNLQLNDFRPAIYAKLYWDRIHAFNGFSYEWATMSDEMFDKAIIPYNGDTPETDYSDYVVQATKSSFTATLGSAITSWTEVQDNQGLFNPTTGVYEPPFYVGAGQAVNYQVTADMDIELVNSSGANAYLVDLSGTVTTQGIEYKAVVKIYINGVYSLTAPLGGGGTIGSEEWLTTDNPLANGTTTLGNVVGTINIPATLLQPTDDLTLVVEVQKVSTGTSLLNNLAWLDANSVNATVVTVDEQIVVNSISIEATLSVNTFSFGQTVEMNNYVPRKIKQKDFIKSVCTMYNLYVEPDKDNPNKLIYKPRDKYYDDGEVKDWTYKLAKERTQDLQFLPDLSAKKLILTYKEDKDSYNQNYLDAVNEIYGQVEFTFDNEYVKGIDKKELIFSPTPTAWNSFGAVIPLLVGGAPNTNIRILLHNGTKTCSPFTITNYTGSSSSSTSYPMVSHFDDHFEPTFDINFAICDYYFYSPIFTLTNNNLFNNYWRRTISQINSGKMLTAFFKLGEDDIQKLSLSDKIRIDNSWWNINRVIDYNANDKQLTKVELISVDEEIELPRFRRRVFVNDVPIKPNKPKKQLADNYYTINNVNYSAGRVDIKGVGNLVNDGLRGVLIGDSALMEESGYLDKAIPTQGQITETYFSIGGWDMDADASKSIALNIDDDKLIHVSVVITSDSGTLTLPINDGGSWNYTSPTLTLQRDNGGAFDTTNYDDDTINRGFVYVKYFV